MSAKANIKWVGNHHTSQIYKSGVELALVSDDNEQVGTFVHCKDFFQDAITASLHGSVCSIYGYTYDPKKQPPVPQKNLKVLITDATDEKFSESVANISHFLHQIERKLNLQLTLIEECESPPDKYKKCGVYLLTTDSAWLMAPPLLSCWTLLARTGLRHKVGDDYETTINSIIEKKIKPAQNHDHTYLQYGKPGLDLILKEGIEACFGKEQIANYPKQYAGNTMHHYSGIVSYGSGVAKKFFPNWKFPNEKTSPPSVCFA